MSHHHHHHHHREGYEGEGFPPEGQYDQGFSQGGYPPGGFPPGAYPQSGGYPPPADPYASGYPPPSQGYPSSTGGYPPPVDPYASSYTPSSQGYSSPPGGYPPPAGGYPPPATGGYPPPVGGSGYPGSTGGYPPPVGGGYPPPVGGSGYPPADPYASTYPPPSQAYPGAPPPGGQPFSPQQGYPPQGFPPPQQQGYGGAPPVPVTPPAYGSAPAGPGSFSAEIPAHPTVVPANPFNPNEDAEHLRKALRTLGSDHKTVIQILAHRSARQRLEIALAFKTAYGKDLVHTLKSDLGGHFEDVAVALINDRPHFEAQCLRHAMKGVGTDEHTLIEIICTRSNEEIRAIKAAYAEEFHRDLEKDVHSETSGKFKHLLISCLTANRSEDPTVNLDQARADAEALYKAGEKRWFFTDESKFNQILCTRSFPQLRAVFQEYPKFSKYDMLRTIEHEMSGDLKEGFKALVHSVIDRPAYFAERLYHSMKGLGTANHTLIRVIITRCEVDMVEIKQAFLANYHKTLAKMIQDDCSGDYKHILIALVGE